MLSAAYNYNGTPFTAVPLGSLLILFNIRGLTCARPEISKCQLFCSTETFYFRVCVCVPVSFYPGSVTELGEMMDCF